MDKLLYTLDDIKKYQQALDKCLKQNIYSKEDVLKAGEIGEVNHHDVKHIVSLLDEAKQINNER